MEGCEVDSNWVIGDKARYNTVYEWSRIGSDSPVFAVPVQ